MCEEESDDNEAVAKLLEINDSIYRTMERYKLMKAGNVAEANKIAKGTLGTTFGVGKNAANELSLIDFDPEPEPGQAAAPADTNGSLLEAGAAPPASGSQTSVEDDLLGLSMDPGPGQGMISLGPTSGSQGPSNIFGSSQQPPPQQQMPSFTSPLASPPPPQPQASPKPNYDAFASLTSALPSSKPTTPQPNLQQQQKQAPVDPFAALVSASSRSTTPLGTRPTSNNQASLLSLGSQATVAPSGPAAQATAAGATADDDWDFASSLPTEPESKTIQVHSSSHGITVAFHAKRQPSNANNIHITASFSNTASQPITGLHFQVAVEKSYTLQLRPQTSREVPPQTQNAVQQEILLSGVPAGAGSKAKMRFKIGYSIGGQPVEEQGSVPSLGIQ